MAWTALGAFGASVRETQRHPDLLVFCSACATQASPNQPIVATAAGDIYQPATAPVQLPGGYTFLALGEANAATTCAIVADKSGTGMWARPCLLYLLDASSVI